MPRRRTSLAALGDIDSTPTPNRDLLYVETRNIYCAEGLRW